MPADEKSYPKCNLVMLPGFIAELGPAGAAQSEWRQGPFERKIWSEHGFKTDGRQHYPIQAYRCPRCGYLECYAQEHG